MIGLDYKSECLTSSNENFKLSSIFSEDNLIYGISRLSDNKLLSVVELPNLQKKYYLDRDYINSLFVENSLFNSRIVEVNFAYLSSEFSLIPNEIEIDSTQSPKRILDYVSIKQYYEDYVVTSSTLKSVDSKNYFPFPKSVLEFLESKYSKVQFFHANDALIERSHQIIEEESFVLANLNGDNLQVLMYIDGKLVHANVYKIKSKEDILYYVLLNLKNQGIPTNIANVYLSGRLLQDSQINTLLYNYIKNLKYVRNIPRDRFSNVFLGKPKHIFFDIYALCEL